MEPEHWTLEQYRRYVSTGQEPPKPPKYHNIRTEIDGIQFDSKKEAQRYTELKYLQECGEITDLRLQVEFTLQEAFTDISGKRMRAIRYKADFTYRYPDGSFVVEDDTMIMFDASGRDLDRVFNRSGTYYIVYGEKLHKWFDFKPTGNQSAALERARLFSY